MTVLEIMKMNKEYCLRYDEIPNELQIKAKTLCWEYIHDYEKQFWE